MSDRHMTAAQVAQSKKKSVYLPKDMASEMNAEAKRLGRSLSWVIQRAWLISRAEMKKIPGQ